MLGELMPQLMAALDPTAKGATPEKLSIFAGHDSCPMMPALVAFGVWDGKWPVVSEIRKSLPAENLLENTGGLLRPPSLGS